MAQVLLTITDTTNLYWRRWNFLTKTETTTGLTDANIDPNGNSATKFKFALNPKVTPLGQGTRLARFGIPGREGVFLQATGSEGLIISLSGEFHNARAGTPNYDFSADPTKSAIADRDCLAWAQNNSVEVKVTLDDGTEVDDMVISSFDFNRIGTVKEGYVYNIEIIQKVA